MRELLVRHFQPRLIEDDTLRRLVWGESPRQTNILIESVYRWRADATELRPAVLIKRNAYQNVKLGINDRLTTDPTGQPWYATLWTGSHTVFCVHATAAGADVLATEIQRELHGFAPVVRQQFDLKRWTVAEVGAAAPVEEARDAFVVPVTVAWAYTESWRVDLESLPLRRIRVSETLL